MAGSYRDLRVWQRAMELVMRVYAETRTFPREELFGLQSQTEIGSIHPQQHC